MTPLSRLLTCALPLLLASCQSNQGAPGTERPAQAPEAGSAPTGSETAAPTEPAAPEPESDPYQRDGFVTRVTALGDSELLWVFREGSIEAREAAQGAEPPALLMPGAGPGGIDLQGPDEATLISYLRSETFLTRTEESAEGARSLWVFRKGSPEAQAELAGSEPSQRVTWEGAGPGGLDLHAVDVTTLHCFVNANLYDTMTEDLDGGFEVLWVFPSGSRGAARYRAGLSPGSHIMMVGVGPGGENICAPDRATAIAFLGRRPGFVTMTEEIGEETLLLWIFREGSAEAAAARAGMRPLRSVSRIGVGPAGISLRAPDVATLDAYMALL